MPLAKGRSAPQNTFLETLAKKFDGTISNFVLGNAQSSRDYPIVYCSDGFCELTGYSRTEVMCKSCSCKFLIGIETEQDAIFRIMDSLRKQNELKADLLLYKKNGAPFWCLLDVMPIKNENGEVVLFLVSHKDVTKTKLAASEERLNAKTTSNGSVSDPSVPRLRKFSRDVLLHIQRQYSGKGVKDETRTNCKPSHRPVGESSSFIPQYKLENAKLPRFMILHFGRARLIWDWIILILVCYIAVMVPFNVAFKTHDYALQFIIADTIVEVFFITDIVINFRTTYIDKKSGRIITQKNLIAMHYLKGWFVIDFLAALPFEALYFTNHSWGFLVSLLKTGRLLRLFRIARRISRYTEYTAALLGLLMFSFALLGHWFACIWYVIGYEELKRKERNGWLHGLGDQVGSPYVNFSMSTGPSKGQAYISSLYFILTSLTTVGFGNIAPNTAAEKVFSVVVLLLGALMQSAIFGNMTAVIQKLYAVRARFHAKATEIKQFVKLHRIENDLKRRIEDYFLTHWSISKGVDTDEMLEFFPSELRADICLHMYKNFLSLACFKESGRGCWRLLSLKVNRAYFGPGELILKERDAIDAIFFVNSGTIEIVQKDCIVAILGSGDLFGDDISRKVPIRRSNGDVRALTYCDLLYLTRSNFLAVLHLYPDFAETFSQRLEMTFNLGLKERDHSACGPLDSISEADEENDVESAEDETLAEKSSLFGNRSQSPNISQLPLWQRQLQRMRSRYNPSTSPASPEMRLMKVESDDSSDDSEEDLFPGNRCLEDNTSVISGVGETRFDKTAIASSTSISNGSEDVLNDASTEIRKNNSYVDDNDLEQSRYSLDNNSRKSSGSYMSNEIQHKEALSVKTNFLTNKRKDIQINDIICHYTPVGQNETVVDSNPPALGGTLVPNLPIIINEDSSSLDKGDCIQPRSCLRRNQDRSTAMIGETNSPPLETNNQFQAKFLDDELVKGKDDSAVYQLNHDAPQNDSDWHFNTDMSWDMLCTSYTDDHQNPMTELNCKNTDNFIGEDKFLSEPNYKLERLSSGVFSRLTDSEPDSIDCSDATNNVNKDGAAIGLNTEIQVYTENSNHLLPSLADDEQSLEQKDLLLENLGIKKDSSVENGSIDKNNAPTVPLSSNVCESDKNVKYLSTKIDALNAEVTALKSEIKSLTGLVRVLIEKKSSVE